MKNSWQTKRLGDVLEIQNGYAFDSKKFSDTLGIPLIRIRDLKNGIATETKYSGEYDKRFEVNDGDFLIGMDGEFGCYEWKGGKALLNQRVCRLIKFNGLDSRFLFYGINKYLKEIEEHTAFTTVKHISSGQIVNINFSFPVSLEEQNRIVKILDEVFEKIEKAKENTEKNLQKSRELFESYLQNVFTNRGNNWEEKKINEVCELKSGTTISPSLERNEGDVLYTKVADMNLPENAIEINTSSRFVNSNEIKKNQIIPEGAVIFPKRGGAIATNKKRQIIKPTIVDLNTMAIVPNKKINKDYFFHWFQLINLNDISNGTSVPQINNYSFDEVCIPYPNSLKEQQAVVQKLDALFAETKKLEAIYKQKLLDLKELKKSILQKAFAGELVN